MHFQISDLAGPRVAVWIGGGNMLVNSFIDHCFLGSHRSIFQTSAQDKAGHGESLASSGRRTLKSKGALPLLHFTCSLLLG